jgi:hypothetical protein
MPAGVSAWTPLANLTLGSSASSVTFSSIVGSYRDLVLVMNCRSNAQNGVGLRLSLNSTPNARFNWLYGSGASASSNYSTGTFVNVGSGVISMATDEYAIVQIDLMDYAQTNKEKTGLTRMNKAGSGGTLLQQFIFETSAATTSLVIQPAFDAFGSGSSFALYGVSA